MIKKIKKSIKERYSINAFYFGLLNLNEDKDKYNFFQT